MPHFRFLVLREQQLEQMTDEFWKFGIGKINVAKKYQLTFQFSKDQKIKNFPFILFLK